MHKADDIRGALLTMETLTLGQQLDFMRLQTIAEGGIFKVPDLDNTWDTHRGEIRLYGVFAEGDTMVAALRNWKKAAKPVADYAAQVEAKIAAAVDLLRKPRPMETDELVSACDTVLQNPHRTPKDIQLLACQLLQSMKTSAAA